MAFVLRLLCPLMVKRILSNEQPVVSKCAYYICKYYNSDISIIMYYRLVLFEGFVACLNYVDTHTDISAYISLTFQIQCNITFICNGISL